MLANKMFALKMGDVSLGRSTLWAEALTAWQFGANVAAAAQTSTLHGTYPCHTEHQSEQSFNLCAQGKGS